MEFKNGEAGAQRGIISRRSFIKGTAFAGVNVAIFGLAGCAPSASRAQGYKAGVYTGSGQGKFAPVVVEMTFSEDEILQVVVTNHEETKYISDLAIESIPQAIVDSQSLAIDTVTGATFTSTALLSACEDCVKQAGGSVSALKSASKASEPSHEQQDIETDLVVVGSGASGMACAVAAAHFGAKNVVVLEKSCNIGGNALVSGGYVGYANAPDELRAEMTDEYRTTLAEALEQAPSLMPQEEFEALKTEVAQWEASGSAKAFDSVRFQSLQDMIDGAGSFQESFIANGRVTDVIDWLVEDGFEIKPLVNLVGYTWPRWTSPVHGLGGQGFFEHYANIIQSKAYPVEVYLNTPATELIQSETGVSGVVAVADDGTTYRITARKGVVLATGGFAGNADMVRKYCTRWTWDENETIPNSSTYGHTGDGIIMAQAVGAALENMDIQKPFAFPYLDVKNYSEETDIGDGIDCPLMVNKEGKRFMNELVDRFEASEQMMAQTDQMMYLIRDNDTCMIEDGLNPYGRKVETLISQGQLYRADTLEDLAEAMGCDVATFVSTVERYNEIARSGDDPDFGRTSFTEKSPLENPPFYASPRTWAMHITTGGIVVDSTSDYTALDERGARIEGLHAVGEVIAGSAGISTQAEGFAVARALFEA